MWYEAYLIKHAAGDEHVVFGYNTLKNPSTRKEIWGGDPGADRHALRGYRTVNTPAGLRTLKKEEGAEARGVVLKLTDNQLRKLDDWETQYRRARVGSLFGKPLQAYLAKRADDETEFDLSAAGTPGFYLPASLAGAGAFSYESLYDRLLGRRRLYHGTTKERAAAIKQTGLDPAFGGTGSAQLSPEYVSHSKGVVHVSPFKFIARPFTLFAQPGIREKVVPKPIYTDEGLLIGFQPSEVGPSTMFRHMFVAHPKGEVVSMDMPEIEYRKRFRVDPDMPGGGQVTSERVPAKRIHGPKHERLTTGQLAKEWPEYVKAGPGRFASGVAGAALTAGSLIAAVKALRRRRKREEPSGPDEKGA